MSSPGQGQVPWKDTAWPHVPAALPGAPSPLTVCLLCQQFGMPMTLHSPQRNCKWSHSLWSVTAFSGQPHEMRSH